MPLLTNHFLLILRQQNVHKNEHFLKGRQYNHILLPAISAIFRYSWNKTVIVAVMIVCTSIAIRATKFSGTIGEVTTHSTVRNSQDHIEISSSYYHIFFATSYKQDIKWDCMKANFISIFQHTFTIYIKHPLLD